MVSLCHLTIISVILQLVTKCTLGIENHVGPDYSHPYSARKIFQLTVVILFPSRIVFLEH